LQVNIAGKGGQQSNVQGNVNAQKAAPAPEPATGNG
jgi:hypothetical protein